MADLVGSSTAISSAQHYAEVMSPVLAGLCAELKLARALNIRLIFCQDHTNSCDLQLVVIARSRPHCQALARLICGVADRTYTMIGAEGWERGEWIALDYQELIIHILDSDTYEIYQRDGLWQEVPGVDYVETAAYDGTDKLS